MFVRFCFWVTSVSWSMLGSLATDTACDENCVDFHRICPAVTNQTFYEEYSAKHASGQLGIFSDSPLPPPPDCDNGFYKTACPRSCEICISCESIVLEKFGLTNSIQNHTYDDGLLSENGDFNGASGPEDNNALGSEQEGSPSESSDLNETPGVQENNVIESEPQNSLPEGDHMNWTPAPQQHNTMESKPKAVKLELSYDKNDKGEHDFYPLGLSVDGDGDTYYRSKSKYHDSGIKEFSFDGEYLVERVHYVGRYGHEYSKHVEISVCDDNGCTPCEKLVLDWGSIYDTNCHDNRGKKIKIQQHDRDTRLFISEIEVWGTEV